MSPLLDKDKRHKRILNGVNRAFARSSGDFLEPRGGGTSMFYMPPMGPVIVGALVVLCVVAVYLEIVG